MSVQGHRMAITLRDLRLEPIQVPHPAGTGAAAGFSMSWNVVYALTVRGRHIRYPVRFYLEGFAFSVGRAQVSLDAMSLSRPFPTSDEVRLFSQLVARAQSAATQAPAAVVG